MVPGGDLEFDGRAAVAAEIQRTSINMILVPGEGIEPTRCHHHRILSPARLPVPPSGRQTGQYMRLALLVEWLAYMQRSDFHFDLPPERIAQRPTATRSASRMLLLDAAAGLRKDLEFRDLPSLLSPLDLLVFNDTRVIPARIFGVKESGGRVEILLERALSEKTALVQLKASKGLRENALVKLPGGHTARMLGRRGDLFHLQFSSEVVAFFEANGEMPLPPYIARKPESADRERYQTVYARTLGAIAAPTAGLHFLADIFRAAQARR